ncbi:MAG TPA: prepilin-type N-terminal cleavage/methylation domain-containing protein [Candidatus Polarisedimenticolaceae bacterium]|nr:prepilin-type N-terminal cleavage/methylation domain-containing protein [Candidatus Polarisedimenticolaceae bacterium]
MERHSESGFSLVEMLVSLTLLLMALSGLAGLLIQSSRVNRSEQMWAEVQGNARNTMSMVVQRLRSAGWDPQNAGLSIVTLDPDLSDNVSELEIFADLDQDGDTDGTDEQTLIRHSGDTVEWRRTGNVADPFEVLAVDITNDEDGDGTPEPMFVPDSVSNPTRIRIQITAATPVPDPVTRQFYRYTVRNDVTLRKKV